MSLPKTTPLPSTASNPKKLAIFARTFPPFGCTTPASCAQPSLACPSSTERTCTSRSTTDRGPVTSLCPTCVALSRRTDIRPTDVSRGLVTGSASPGTRRLKACQPPTLCSRRSVTLYRPLKGTLFPHHPQRLRQPLKVRRPLKVRQPLKVRPPPKGLAP